MSSKYINLKDQEATIRDFIKRYSAYLDRSELANKKYYRLHGKAYLESVNLMLDKSGTYIFDDNFDDRMIAKQPRICLWLEGDACREGDFLPITGLRIETFKREFEKRNNVKRKKYK